jgi:HNH endonuclease
MARPKVSLKERFATSTKKDRKTGCWIWLKGTDIHGYAKIKHDGRTRKVASVAYEFYCGPIPKGLEISHVCPKGANRLCVNPKHLIAETHSANLRRRRPFPRFKGGLCKRGHPLPPVVERNKNRSCPICYREYQAAYKKRHAKELAQYWRAYRRDPVNRERRNAKRRKAVREIDYGPKQKL